MMRQLSLSHHVTIEIASICVIYHTMAEEMQMDRSIEEGFFGGDFHSLYLVNEMV